MKKKMLSQVFLAVLWAGPLGALELQNTSVTFEAVGKPSFLKIKGETKEVKHVQKTEAGTIVDTFLVDLSTLDSGIELRDEHMKEKYLKTKENPRASLELSSPDKSVLEFQGEKELKGILTLNGKAKEIAFIAKRQNATLEARFEIKLTDFAIEIPSWSGITVADSVKIKASFDVPLAAPSLAR